MHFFEIFMLGQCYSFSIFFFTTSNLISIKRITATVIARSKKILFSFFSKSEFLMRNATEMEFFFGGILEVSEFCGTEKGIRFYWDEY